MSHAASAFFPSPFEESAILCLDAVGEWATTSVWLGKNNNIFPLWEINFPHSLGLLYSAFTQRCGLKPMDEEYITMGMAGWGEPKYKNNIKEDFIKLWNSYI